MEFQHHFIGISRSKMLQFFSFATLCSWILQNATYMREKNGTFVSATLTNCNVKKAKRCKPSRVWYNPTLNVRCIATWRKMCNIHEFFKNWEFLALLELLHQEVTELQHWKNKTCHSQNTVAVNQNQCPNLFSWKGPSVTNEFPKA